MKDERCKGWVGDGANRQATELMRARQVSVIAQRKIDELIDDVKLEYDEPARLISRLIMIQRLLSG